MIRQFNAVAAVTLMIAGALSGAVAPAVQAAPSPGGKAITVIEGVPSIVSGQVPVAYRNDLAVLEIVDGRKRQEIAFAVPTKDGGVSASVVVGGAGTYQGQWRLVSNGRTRWTSAPFALEIIRRGKPTFSPRAEAVFQHASPAAAVGPATRIKATSGVDPTARSRSAAISGPVTKSVTDESAETASKTSGQMMKDLGASMREGVGSTLIGDGVTAVFGVIFPKSAQATSSEVTQLSSQVAAGFSAVEAQIQQVQSSLDQVEQQVTTVQNEVVQANASATASTCAALLGQANTYVNEIQAVYGNYETTLDPQWIQANLVGQSPQSGLRILGTTIFGTGAGQPPFAGGVSELQTSVTALGRLMTANGPSSAESLLGACSSAIAANVDAQFAQQQSAQNLQQGWSIIAAGAVDEAYFGAMQSLTAYYTGWLALGQTLASRGGQMGLAVLQGSTITSASQVNAICKGQAPQQGSVLTCGGILANIEQSVEFFDSAWAETGASWFDVTNGLLVADTKAGNASGFFTAPQHLWVQDIARYGENLPLIDQTTSTATLAGASFSAGVGTPFLTINPTYATSGLGTVNPSVTLTGTVNAGQVAGGAALTFTSASGSVYPASGAQYLAAVGASGSSYAMNQAYVPWTVVLPLGPAGAVQAYTASYGESPTYSQSVTWSYSAIAQTLSSSAGGYTPSGPLTSTGPGQSVPAAMSAYLGLAETSWLGLDFQAAKTSTWQSLIATGGQPLPSGTSGNSMPMAGQPGYLGTVGSLMSQGGLMNFGSVPTNLILWTGETGTFDPSTATNWFQQEPNSSGFGNSNFDEKGQQELAPTPALYAYSFLDSNAGLLAGMNPVVSAPSGVGFSTTLGNVMSGGAAGLQQSWCSPPNASKESCSTSVSSSFSLSGGPTGNNAFYSPYTVNYSYNLSAAYGQTGGTVTFSDYSDSVASYNSTMLGQPVQQQYGWPVSQLTNGVPAGSSCSLTSFTQGVDGNAGVTNVCADLYDDWMAGALGVTTGPVSISGGGYQGTVTTAGNNVMQAFIVNTSSSPQTVTLVAGGTNGAQVGSTATAASGGSGTISNIACGNPVTAALECSLTVPPGTSVMSIPLIASNGTVNLALGSSTSASSSITQVTATAASLTELPGAITGLSAVSANAAGTAVLVEWTPPSATPPVSGYTFVLESPTGTMSTLTTGGSTPVTVTTSGGSASASIPVPGGQAGVWSIAVSAQNAAGTGPASTVSAALGNSVPPTPANFQAVSRDDGFIRLTWNPVQASPVLTNYTVQITTPGTAATPSQTFTEVSSVPAFTLFDVPQVGRYTFTLTANNSLGSSLPATSTVTITGTVPTPPLAVDATVDAEGWISASWLSAISIPPTDSYQVALYTPGANAASKPVASVQVPAPIKVSSVRVPSVYQLAKTSPIGAWLIVVTPTNPIGTGQFATAQLYVTSGVLSRVTKVRDDAGEIAAAPAIALARASTVCAAGTWSIGYSAFGTCVNGAFTPWLG